MKNLILDILRGVVIGLANLIPGVSGGTMMVSMGIYDKLIDCINHLFTRFKQSILTLLPYGIGMVLAIAAGSFGLKAAFANFPLPTNALFIGLIFGSVPMILSLMKGEKKGIIGGILFAAFFALVVVLKAIEKENSTEMPATLGNALLALLLGCIASATMVIPGVSGSMMLKTLGYYEPIVTEALPDLITALLQGNWPVVGERLVILLPFLIGIVAGILGIAKLIEVLMRKWKGYTYCAILGMVLASPVAVLMDKGVYEKGTGAVLIIASVLCAALGVFIALKLGGEKQAEVKE